MSRITTPLSTLTVRLKLSRSRRRAGDPSAEDSPDEGPHRVVREPADAPRRAGRGLEPDAADVAADSPPKARRNRRRLLAAAGAAALIAALALGIHLHYRSAIGERDQALAAARANVDAKDQQLGFMAEELRQKEDRLRTLRGDAAVAPGTAPPTRPGTTSPGDATVAPPPVPAPAGATVAESRAEDSVASRDARPALAKPASAAAEPPPPVTAGGDCELKGANIGDKLRECIAAFNRASR